MPKYLALTNQTPEQRLDPVAEILAQAIYHLPSILAADLAEMPALSARLDRQTILSDCHILGS